MLVITPDNKPKESGPAYKILVTTKVTMRIPDLIHQVEHLTLNEDDLSELKDMLGSIDISTEEGLEDFLVFLQEKYNECAPKNTFELAEVLFREGSEDDPIHSITVEKVK